jgi:hypothetical protein
LMVFQPLKHVFRDLKSQFPLKFNIKYQRFNAKQSPLD